MGKLSPEDISRAREHRQKSSWHAWSDEKVAAYSAAENERLTLERDRLKGALQDMLKLAKMLIRYTSENPSITQGWRTRIEAAEAALGPEGE